jgi:hypothetical protein
MLPFKFYTRLDAQTRFKRHCEYQNQYELVSRTNRFLPFILKRSTISTQLKSWRVYNLDGILKYTIDPATTSYEIYTVGTSQYLIYYGAQISGLDMNCGNYYLKVSDNTNTWYSEVFTVKDFATNTNPYSTLKWSHNHDVGDIIYQTGYQNWLYLPVDLGEPDYNHEEEVTKDVLGVENDILIRNQKVYKSIIPALPEYLVDALSLSLYGADNITLTIPENEETLIVKQARASVEWINDGCFANVELTFKVEESLIQKTCNTDEDLTSVPVTASQDPDIVLISVSNESGTNMNDGSLEVDVSNYDEPEYSIDNVNFQSTGIFSGLGDGTYTVYVRVESGKTGTLEVVVNTNIGCGTYAGATIQDLIDDGVILNQILNCTLNDFI